MREQEPTVRSRELGDGLREVMRQAGLNGQQTAHLLDLSPSWVSRLLSGKRGCTELDVAAFLGVCRVKGAERDRLLALCQQQRAGTSPCGWCPPRSARMPR
jgi:transcriptional regulator with XRE-family HTH domain